MEQESMVGRTVVGRFRVERIIGRGGMASVYAAVDERSGKKIAIKLLKRELTRDPTVLRRFEREAKAASHLRHPNIIEVFESGIEGEDAFIAMELANGKDLLKALSQERPMRQVRAVLILAQVCAALDAAHAKGIVHRDLKPENIVLVADTTEPGGERAKVLDFGIAKILDVSGKPGSGDPTDPPSYVTKTALTRVGTIVGTPAYMSPEQCRGGDLDGRSDIYTCGVLLYQLVTGDLPFTGETPLHTAMRHIHAQPRPVSELRRDVSPALERNILKALAKWPGERHQTASQLREELLACLPDLPDRGDVVLPDGFVSPTSSKRGSMPDADQPQPTRMLVGGPLGSTPLRAVRLGGPGGSRPPPAPPADPAPQAPPAGSQPPPAPTEPDDDDDEPRTFLMSPDAAQQSRAAGSPAPAKVQVRTEALPSTPPPAQPAAAPTAPAPPPAAAAAAPTAPTKSPIRTTQIGGVGLDRAGNISARPGNTAVAHAKTAPAGGAPAAPVTEGPRSPSRSERPLRTPRAPSPSTAPRPATERPAPPVNLRTPKTTETGLTPTTQTTVPSSNDPPTRKKDPSPSPQPTPVIDPLSATAAGSPPGSPTTPDPSRRLDDDEIPTGQRDPGPPDRRGGVHTTLVMEETAAGSTRAPEPHSQAPRGQVPREMAIAPTLLAGKNAPTAAQVEAEALRSLKETTRMSPEEAANSQAVLAQQIAQRSATMRMNPQDPYAQSPGAPPPAALARPMPGPLGAQQPMQQGSGALGWNEATVMRRRQPGSDQLAPGKAGLVGELESLPGTTGFLIGIGLGLGIAAGVVIALLVMR